MSEVRLFDAHAHINEAEYSPEEREELARAIEASDVAYVVDQGYDLASSRQAVADAAKYDWCYCVVGMHPHDTKTMTEEVYEEIRGLYSEHKVCGIGEIGLDFHYDLSERDIQRYWFRRQIRLANELKAPIVIHSREAEAETMEILKEEGAFSKERQSWFPTRKGPDGEELPDSRVLIHCFSGSAETARQYVKLGATISICGPVTYKNARKLVEVVEQIPIEFLTIETDAPYLAPVPKRGKPNMSPYVEYVARRVAVIKEMTYEDVCRITCENGKRFYNIG